MISKRIVAPLIIVIIASGIGGVLTAQKVTQNRLQKVQQASNSPANASTETPEALPETVTDNTTPGRYQDYSDTAANEPYDKTILFFFASWCPECRAFKQAIQSGAIPDGVQILEVNYDTASELKQKHGVTLQTTFVLVNSTGDTQAKWVGYEKDKSIAAMLENL